MFFEYKTKISEDDNYKQMWMACETEKRKFPEMFSKLATVLEKILCKELK